MGQLAERPRVEKTAARGYRTDQLHGVGPGGACQDVLGVSRYHLSLVTTGDWFARPSFAVGRWAGEGRIAIRSFREERDTHRSGRLSDPYTVTPCIQSIGSGPPPPRYPYVCVKIVDQHGTTRIPVTANGSLSSNGSALLEKVWFCPVPTAPSASYGCPRGRQEASAEKRKRRGGERGRGEGKRWRLPWAAQREQEGDARGASGAC